MESNKVGEVSIEGEKLGKILFCIYLEMENRAALFKLYQAVHNTQLIGWYRNTKLSVMLISQLLHLIKPPY